MVTTTHKLPHRMHGRQTSRALETAVGRFTDRPFSDQPLSRRIFLDKRRRAPSCQRDAQVPDEGGERLGWALASLPEGFVHNRTFADAAPGQMGLADGFGTWSLPNGFDRSREVAVGSCAIDERCVFIVRTDPVRGGGVRPSLRPSARRGDRQALDVRRGCVASAASAAARVGALPNAR